MPAVKMPIPISGRRKSGFTTILKKSQQISEVYIAQDRERRYPSRYMPFHLGLNQKQPTKTCADRAMEVLSQALQAECCVYKSIKLPRGFPPIKHIITRAKDRQRPTEACFVGGYPTSVGLITEIHSTLHANSSKTSTFFL